MNEAVLTVNGAPTAYRSGLDLQAVITDLIGRADGATSESHDAGPTGVAAAINGAVVPRTQWPTIILQPGDRIEIVGAVQGG